MQVIQYNIQRTDKYESIRSKFTFPPTTQGEQFYPDKENHPRPEVYSVHDGKVGYLTHKTHLGSLPPSLNYIFL